MPRLHTAQTNFSSGELDPTMRMRTDTGAYQNGVGPGRNMRLLNTGGGQRRPGFYHRAALAGPSRLRRFEFDADERYVFAFQHNQVQIFDRFGVLLTTLTGGRWTLAQLRQMTFCQLGDTLILFHPAFRPHVVRRTGLTTFVLQDFSFAEPVSGGAIAQPFFKFADDAMTMTPSGVTGTITLTASAAFFTAAHVGTRLKLFETQVQIMSVTSATVASAAVAGTLRASFDANPIRTVAGTGTVHFTLAFHGLANGQILGISGANEVGGITTTQLNATHTVFVTDKHSFYIQIAGAAATSSSDGGGPSVQYAAVGIPTRKWQEAVYSAANGWPACGTFHQQRLFIAGGPEMPAGLWGSETGDFFSFDLANAEETAGIGVQVGQENGVSIRHLASAKHLLIFTEVGEFYVPQQAGVGMVPLGIQTPKQSPYGVGAIEPASFDGAIVFMQKSGTALREMMFTTEEGGYNSAPLSLVASHVLRVPVDMAVVYGTDDRPEQYTHVVNADGTMATFHSARVERLAGWASWDTPGSFYSVTTLNNDLWACVNRSGSYWLEELSSGEMTLDGATEFTNATAQKIWNVGARYAGLTVSVCTRGADGLIEFSLGTHVVSAGGVLTLGSAHARIVVGFDHGFELNTLPPVIVTDKGPQMGETMRIAQVTVGLHSSLGIEVDGQAMILRQVNDDMSAAPERVSGYRRFVLLGYSDEPTISIRQLDPLPLTITGLVLKVSL